MTGIVRVGSQSYRVTRDGWVPADATTAAVLDAAQARTEDVPAPGHSQEAPSVVVPLPRRTSWTADELMAADFPPARFAVTGLLPEGLTFMCGAPKLGKSWLALGLGIAVASGGRALGTIEVEQGDVLYLALEDSPRRLRERLRIVLRDDEAPKALHIYTEWPRLDEGGREALGRWLDEHPRARLVLVDVWPRIRPHMDRRADHFTADYEAAAELQGVAIGHAVAFGALYHTRKAAAEDFVDLVTGTFGTAAAADTILVVKRSRGKADATLHVTGRDVEEQEVALRFAPEAGTWVTLDPEAALHETRRQLLAAIRTHGALTPKQAADVSPVGYELAKKTLQRMADDGQLSADRGVYTFIDPVPGVPLSPYEGVSGTEGQEGQGFRKDEDR